MTANLFTGQKVRLAAQNPETDPELYARWSSDSVFLRLMNNDPARPSRASEFRQDIERTFDKEHRYPFAVRTLADDQLIGFVALWIWSWPDAHGGLGIGLGHPDYRGRGYGTDAMRLALRYAFNELNLDRMTLQAAAYNARAIRSYEKAGYVLLGAERERELRDGQRRDEITMTLRRADWNNSLGDTLLPYIHAFDKPADRPATEQPQ